MTYLTRGTAVVRWAVALTLCFVILGPIGPRKLLRAVSPLDRVAMLSDTDGADEVQLGVLPEMGVVLPVPSARVTVRHESGPVAQTPRGWIESPRAPPA